MENQAYHSAGTCTLLWHSQHQPTGVLEAMGLMLPGSAFIAPNSELRHALTNEVAALIPTLVSGSAQYRPLYKLVDENHW